MCLERSTWRRLHGWSIFIAAVLMFVAWGQLLLAWQQSQDGINATLQVMTTDNMRRIEFLEGQVRLLDQQLAPLRWISSIATLPLVVEVIKWLLKAREAPHPSLLQPPPMQRRRRDDLDD